MTIFFIMVSSQNRLITHVQQPPCCCKERDAANEKLLECQHEQKQLQKAAANGTWQWCVFFLSDQFASTVHGFRNPAAQLEKGQERYFIVLFCRVFILPRFVGDFQNHQQ